ncbi:MAG: VWA domain-containing protein [Myxococcales bacterium]|nr:VWA domain-containing protein [Myxococcales bacterium]
MKRLAPLLTVVLLACGGRLDTFSLDPDGGTTTSDPDAGTPGPLVQVVPADILFVIDNSGSIIQSQENLATNFSNFVDQVAGAGDYRIAVVTTDLDSSGGEQGGLTTSTYSTVGPYYPLDSTNGDACVFIGLDHACFRNPDPSHRVIDSRALDRPSIIAAFQDAVQVGTCGSGMERGLEAALTALEQDGCTGTPFLRPGANLIVIFVTDEDDASSGPVNQYVQRLLQLKPAAQLRVAVIGGVLGGAPSRCSLSAGSACGSLCEGAAPDPGSGQSCQRNTECPAGEFCSSHRCTSLASYYWNADPTNCAWCSYFNAPDCCAALPATRYVTFARAVEQEVHDADPFFPVANCVGLGSRVSCLADSVCQTSFGDTLARIARELMLSQ